jgi:nucleoid DNA-binding protein
MDIDLLSKIVKEIVLDNDSVTLPGIGSFLAEIVPSSFSDKGYTINPPYRRLYFTRKEGNDTLLVDFYASSNKVSRDDATRIVVTFLSEMRDVLKEKKTVHFPGLGRLRATKENNFFFIPDEDLDIYPAGFGLAPISLKTHEETEDEVSAAVAGIASVLEEPLQPLASREAESAQEVEASHVPQGAQAPQATKEVMGLQEAPQASMVQQAPQVPQQAQEPQAPLEPQLPQAPEISQEPQGAHETKAPQKEPKEAPKEHQKKSVAVSTPVMTSQEALEDIDKKELRQARKGWRRHRRLRLSKIVLIVLGVLLLLLIIYAIIARVNPAFVDRFLYSEEELEIIKMMKL